MSLLTKYFDFIKNIISKFHWNEDMLNISKFKRLKKAFLNRSDQKQNKTLTL